MSNKLAARRKALGIVGNKLTNAVVRGTVTKTYAQLDEEERRALKLAPHVWLDNFENGKGTYRDWNMLTLRLNTGQLAAKRYVKEVRPRLYFKAALDVMRDTYSLFETQDRVRFTPEQVSDVADALAYTDAIQDLCTRVEWHLLVKEVFDEAGVK
jgi:hypothetical protein